MFEKQVSLFTSFAKEHGLELPENFLGKILEFCEILLEANKSTNLVSKNDSQKLLTRHVADSLVFACCLNHDSDRYIWADIGSGAGFPVVPLCVYFPQVKFYAIESRKKRCEFLEFVRQKLDLRNLEIVRGNTCSRTPNIVSCRAVGSLENDFELAKKILKKGGHFLTLKSKRIIDELKAKNSSLLKRANVWNYRLPEEEMEYALVHIFLP
ncbi:MAG: 16S rRNA (guanine(527)-N(7))-methyltransferase RsmG [Fibromonadaceae bacterium]|nr:16S rRNA (guanine(527)-N(7))-methyltransferase RsmG [Fibromonadaceae bacterium]